MKTAFTTLLGIDYPIVQAPMAGGPTTPELVAAVSEAGGLGFFGVAHMQPDAIHAAAARVRELTSRPFGMNLFAPAKADPSAEEVARASAALDGFRRELGIEATPAVAPYAPDFDAQLDAVIAAKPAILSFHFGLPADAALERVKAAGIPVMVAATTVEEAELLEAKGVDAICAQGSEAGGHRGTFNHDPADAMIGLMALVPQIASRVDLPVIAAGGIMDGRGIAAALALGAAGVQMGTAFLGCPESGASETHKNMLGQARDDRTVVTRAFSGRPARALGNRFIREMAERGASILPFPAQNALTRDLRAAAARQNRSEFMSLWAGQAAALCRGLPAGALVRALVAEYEAVAEGLPR